MANQVRTMKFDGNTCLEILEIFNESEEYKGNLTTTTVPDVYSEISIFSCIRGSLIFMITFPFIVLHMNWFPIGPTGAVLIGSLLMAVS